MLSTLNGKVKTVSIRDRTGFLTRLSVLLKEGYLLPTALALLLPVHTAKPEAALSGIEVILRGGGTAAEILEFLGFRKSVLFSAAIAEHHGKLPEAISSIAQSFGRTEAVSKKLRSVLIYPLSLLLFTSMLFLLFRIHYIPQLTELTSSLHQSDTASAASLHLLKLPDLFLAVLAAAIGGGGAAVLLIGRLPADGQIRSYLAIPGVRFFLQLYWTQSFSRELGTLLHSGISLQESLAVLKNQKHDGIMQSISTSVHEEVVMGIPLSEAVSHFAFFAADFKSFSLQGESTGLLGRELLLFSELLMERLEKIVQRLIRLVQPLFFLMIAACIIGAYLAILLPMYQLVHTI